MGKGTSLRWTLPDDAAGGDMLRLPGLTLIDPDYRPPEPPQLTNVEFGHGITLVSYWLDPQSVTIGAYSLIVGWYNPAAPGERLPASGSGSIQSNLLYIPVTNVP